MTCQGRVGFRVDESAKVGRGHISRCRALAEALMKAGAQVSFYCRDIRPDTKVELQNLGIQVVGLPDEEAFLSRDWRGQIVIVDGYQFDEDFWQRLLATHPQRSVCIDDLRDIRYVADLVICYNEGVDAARFQFSPGTRLMLGGRYLLLRSAIHDAARLTDRPTPRCNVMIASGGSRQEQWVTEMLRKLALVESRATLWVLSGRRLPKVKILSRAGLYAGQVRFLSNLGPAEMLRLYRRARYLVAPASTIMLEAFTVGCPLITGWIAENQRNSLNFYERHGLVVNLGNLYRVTHHNLILARSRVRREGRSMIRRQRAYIATARTGIGDMVKAVLADNNLI